MEREGGDITAQDMISSPVVPSNIQKYFAGSTILVTGGTGFLGRLLVEKLLRTCFDLHKLYLLVRPKKGKTCSERFKEYFDDILYEPLKREKPEAMTKLRMIEGDCGLPDLGLSDQDRKTVISEVNCIFHVAATVRFDEKLRLAAHINVRGTKDILRLAKSMKNLRSFVYVSTAYSFCPRKTIDEEFYEPTITGDKLLALVESLDEDMLEKIVPTLIGEWPNTYAFTKAVAEDIVKKESNRLPVAVVRPSIVVVTAKEPVAGWINNFYGATGIFVGASLGLIRSMHCEANYIADLVPADYVINTIIAAAWDIAKRDFNSEISSQDNDHSNVPIYNYVSSTQNPITWKECTIKGNQHVEDIPTPLQVWHYFFFAISNKYVHLFLHYMLHLLPAYIIDFLAASIGKKPQMVKIFKKVEKFLNVTSYFSTRQWNFRNNNTQNLWNKLNTEDKKLFEFNMKSVDWDVFFYTFCRGCRVYLLKDPLETVPQGYAKRFRLKIAHYTLLILLASIFLLIIWRIFF